MSALSPIAVIAVLACVVAWLATPLQARSGLESDGGLAALSDTRQVDPAELTKLGGQARRIAKVHCGNCHGDDKHEGKPDALEVFDLKKRDWYRGLSLEQLQGAQKRIDGKADEPDIARFRAFVKLASRRVQQKSRR